jgi:hypothetical protein
MASSGDREYISNSLSEELVAVINQRIIPISYVNDD